MCGRFTQFSSIDDIADYYDLDADLNAPLNAGYNIAPGASIYTFGVKKTLQIVRWGLIPSWWSKSLNDLPSTFNARSEGINTKPMFRAAFQKRRCIIPVNGFFEWTGPKGQRQP